MKKKRAIRNIKWITGFTWHNERPVLYGLFAVLPVLLAEQYMTFFLPQYVISAMLDTSDKKKIVIGLILISTALCAFMTGNRLLNYMVSVHLDSLRQKFMKTLYGLKMSLPYQKIETASFSDQYNKASESLMNHGETYDAAAVLLSCGELGKAICAYIVFGSLLAGIDIKILLLITITPCMEFLMRLIYNRYQASIQMKQNTLERRIWYIVSRCGDYKMAKDIRLYGMNEWLIGLYNSLVKERLSLDGNLIKKRFRCDWIQLMIILCRDGLTYYMLIKMALDGTLQIGEFVFYFSAIGSFSTWIGQMIGKAIEIHSLSLGIEELRELVLLGSGGILEEKKTVEPLPIEKIELQNVSFRYGDSGEEAVKNINISIRSGERLALVGANGAGKTTLVKLLCGLYKPTCGEVIVNGKPISSWEEQEVFSLFSIVFQDFNFYHTELARIISSLDKVDLSRAKDVLKQVGLWDKVQSLPDGIHTPIGKQLYENGTELSGGEIQKLMLAKALYKNSPVVILDEPTAALDPIAERNLYFSYQKNFEGKIKIFISHRLASTRFCDRILYMEAGQIVEMGTHEELIALNGRYKKLFDVQASYYKEQVQEESI